jgi:Flp pilus assembly protein TadD
MSTLDRIRRSKIQSQAEGFLELGLPQQALQCLGRLGDPATLDPTSLYLWGEGLRSLGRCFEALTPLERAVKAAPDDIRIRMALGWCYKRTGRLDLAIVATEEALATEPDEPVLYYNLACYLCLAQHRRRALQALATALKLDPRFGKLVDNESDFDSVRSDPEFQTLCEQARSIANES